MSYALAKEKQNFNYKGTTFEPEEIITLSQANLSDRWWRLNNLYYVVNEYGEIVKFKMRPAQKAFFDSMWYRNVILKSRQHGFSTAIDIFILDAALFTPNLETVIIAHKKDSATKIMETKIEFPYTNLHPDLKAKIQLVEHNKTTLKFSNGSSVNVLTSARSGTANIVHVSELGYISRHRPDVAEEIITGSFPAAHDGSFIFVESTADGREGEFYDLVTAASNKHKERKKLTRSEFKRHFYSWFDKKENRLDEEEAEIVEIPYRLTKYFIELESNEGITLDEYQRKWYVVQEGLLGDKMQQEHPSTEQEAFDASGEGHYFSVQMTDMRKSNRITVVPHQTGRLVHTFWDLGVNDEMAIWVMQRVGKQWNAIDYIEDTDFGMDHYINLIHAKAKEEKWALGEWWAPHDIKKRAIINAVTIHRQAQDLGVSFKVVPKVEDKSIAITSARRALSLLTIDEGRCEHGIERLDNYRKEWDAIRGTWKDKPRHDRNSNGADALQTWSLHLDAEALRQDEGRARKDPRTTTPGVAAGRIIKPSGFTRRPSSMKGYTC